MKRNLYCFLSTIILLLTLGCSQLFSQVKGGTISSSRLRSIFENANGPDSRLVSGKLYRGAQQGSITGTPYYLDENWKLGYVIIDSLLFDSLLLKYDILENKLVLNTASISNSNALLCLNLEKINRFGIDGRSFIPYPRENDSPGPWFAESVVKDTLSYLILKKRYFRSIPGLWILVIKHTIVIIFSLIISCSNSIAEEHCSSFSPILKTILRSLSGKKT